MRFYQRMLFVGLGGTGLKVGAELYRRLREDLCGPDGRRLLQYIPELAPNQVPEALQFVFADLDERDRERYSSEIPRQNLTKITQLAPYHRSYSEAAESLRISAADSTKSWLPSRGREPRVSPLANGAAAFPTAARAALFSVISRAAAEGRSYELLTDPLREPLSRLAKAAGQLSLMAGKQRVADGCDVFVAFSVAGGTGCGLFYDFLHYIHEAFDAHAPDTPFQIYPLVVMPSAFREEEVNPRFAKLNAARALLDLFRLIDHQNAHFSADEKKFKITYPGGGQPLYIKPGTIQTAHLFRRPDAIEPEDLYRSIVELLLSMISTQADSESDDGGIEPPMSFAQQFLNNAGMRMQEARSGIGRRGVATGLVAALTLPQDQIAEVFADRLLGRAVEQLAVPSPGERNLELRQMFTVAAGLAPLAERPALDPRGLVTRFDTNLKGAGDISRELSDRMERMAQHLGRLPDQLDDQVSRIAQFDYRAGLDALLQQVPDPFRVERVIYGHQNLEDKNDRDGFLGLLNRWAKSEPAPEGLSEQRPRVPVLRNTVGVVPLRTNNKAVLDAVVLQDQWYQWRIDDAWSAAWQKQSPDWRRTIEQLKAKLGDILNTLRAHQRDSEQAFKDRCAALSRERHAIRYLLPTVQGQKNLDLYYTRHFLPALRREDSAGQREKDDLNRIVGEQNGWVPAFRRAYEQDGSEALSFVRQRLKEAARTALGETEPGLGRPAPLPQLGELLAAQAAGQTGSLLDQLRQDVINLMPSGFIPDGEGELEVLVSFPSSTADALVEEYLKETLVLQLAVRERARFTRNSSESLVVVLRRSQMSVDEVKELREAVEIWMQSSRDERPGDFRNWRQRLGFQEDYTLSERHDREVIIQALLSVLWDGDGAIDIEGPLHSPSLISIRPNRNEDAKTLDLRLTPFGEASSWGSLINEYERHILTDNVLERELCRQLIGYKPEGLTTGQLKPPSAVYRTFMALQASEPDELSRLAATKRGLAQKRILRYQRFWSQEVPAAMEREFPEGAFYMNHAELLLEYPMPPTGSAPFPPPTPDEGSSNSFTSDVSNLGSRERGTS